VDTVKGGEALWKEHLAQNSSSLGGLTELAFGWVSSQKLSDSQRRQLLERQTRPYLPNLVQLVADDMKAYGTSFGGLSVHNLLTLPQLVALRKARNTLFGGDALIDDAQWVNAYLTRLLPSAEVDLRSDLTAREKVFDTLWDFARDKLGPAMNSVRAAIMHAVLDFDLSRGKVSQKRLLDYLELPKYTQYSNPEWVSKKEFDSCRAYLGGSPPLPGLRAVVPGVSDDTRVVRASLLALLRDAAKPSAFEKFVETGYLKDVHAEARLLAGAPEVEKLALSLVNSESRLAELRTRVDIDFARENQRFFGPRDRVELAVDVKNVDKLIVKLFQINASAYYRDKKREIDTAVNLDGLVPFAESTLDYKDTPPLHRVRRSLALAELDGRAGVFVVELIGNGKSSRALVHKGCLKKVERVSAAGHVFVVLDQDDRPCADAEVWMDGHLFQASGASPAEILIPFTHQPGGRSRQPVVLSSASAKLCSVDFFDHKDESFTLSAGFFADRGALIPGRKATVLVRAALFCAGVPVPAALLSADPARLPTLTFDTVDSLGVPSQLKVPSVKLSDDGEFAYEFKCPDRLRRLTVTLEAKVRLSTTGAVVTLTGSNSFALNESSSTADIDDLFLRHTRGGIVLSFLGRTGEAKASRALAITVRDRGTTGREGSVTVMTDAAGCARIGQLLPTASSITARDLQSSRTWTWPLLPPRANNYPARLHSPAGKDIVLPHASGSPAHLFELRGGAYSDDVSARAKVDAAAGLLTLQALAPGDYELYLPHEAVSVSVSVAAGDVIHSHIIAASRVLELTSAPRVQITSAVADKTSLRITVANATPRTRVHVIASHFAPAWDAFANLSCVAPRDPRRATVPLKETLYVSGRTLGEEYRYVLERRFAEKRAGNMLPRPRVLLNPWAVRSTETSTQDPATGEQYRSGAALMGEGYGGGGGGLDSREGLSKHCFDFLAEPSALLANARPDAQGCIVIPAKDLFAHGRSQVTIVAVDVDSAAAFRLLGDEDAAAAAAAAPPSPSAAASASVSASPLYRDLRLLNGLDPAGHFSEARAISALGCSASDEGPGAGDSLRLPDVATAELETLETLGRVHGLLVTLSRGNLTGSLLTEFSFIAQWDSLSRAEKEEKYSAFACHELSFFLYARDPEFFARVVRPYLANKLRKTFLDHWLLGDNLSAYLEPQPYSRLNTVERILLGSAHGAEGLGVPARHLGDLVRATPINHELRNSVFEAALKSKSLDADDSLGFGAAKAAAEAAARDAGRGRMMAQEQPMMMMDMAPMASMVMAAPPPPGAPMPVMAARSRAAMMPMGGAMMKKKMAAPRLAEAKEMTLMKSLAVDEEEECDEDRSFCDDDASSSATGADFFAGGPMDGLVQARESAKQLYKPKEKTMEYAENNYYKLTPAQQGPELVPVNAFWADWAAHLASGSQARFLSPHFGLCTSSFAEAMFALSVLNVPFQPAGLVTRFEGAGMTLSARGPALAVHKQLQPAPLAPGGANGEVLIAQNLFDPQDAYQTEPDGERTDKYVDELVKLRVYGCRVIVTNVSNRVAKLDVLTQIPEGALPVQGALATASKFVCLHPFRTETITYFFYVPRTGVYNHFPAHASNSRGEVVASAPAKPVRVVERLSAVDRTTWLFISQEGTEQEVLAYLATRSLAGVDLDLVAWRCYRSKDSFLAIIAALRARKVFSARLWSYALHHGDLEATVELLPTHDSLCSRAGTWLESPVLRVDGAERGWYEHLEYDPLVNARAHRLGQERKILNGRFAEQYESFVRHLRYKPRLLGPDLLALAYYLVLQDRVDEAARVFGQIERPPLAPLHINCAGCNQAVTTPLAFRSADPAGASALLCDACHRALGGNHLGASRGMVRRTVHHDTACDGCDKQGIEGTRYKSLTVPNFDVCEKCFEGRFKADPKHRFVEIQGASDSVIFLGSVPSLMQYDYMAAYLAFSGFGDLSVAREAHARYRDHPVPRWRKLFTELGAQLAEIDGTAERDAAFDRDNQDHVASREPTVEMTIDASHGIRLTHSNLDRVKVNLYVMDVELLFSTSPFLQNGGGSDQFGYVVPNHTMEVPLRGDGAATTDVALPAGHARHNLFVEVLAAGIRRTGTYFANSLLVNIVENYGQVLVRDAATKQPVPRAYVKVYQRSAEGGQGVFWKDGYTDMRGKFDYAGLSTTPSSPVQRFAILVSTPEHGAVIREAKPPLS
jgi:hypothetical protein